MFRLATVQSRWFRAVHSLASAAEESVEDTTILSDRSVGGVNRIAATLSPSVVFLSGCGKTPRMILATVLTGPRECIHVLSCSFVS